jgi:hypothetical protein
MWTDKNATTGKFYSFGFKAPAGASVEKNEVLFPFHEKQTPDYAATIAATVKQMDTFIQPATLTGAATLNLTIDPQVTVGAKLHLKLRADATQRVVTLGTGFDDDAANITVAISSVVFASFVYDGTAFVPVG